MFVQQAARSFQLGPQSSDSPAQALGSAPSQSSLFKLLFLCPWPPKLQIGNLFLTSGCSLGGREKTHRLSPPPLPPLRPQQLLWNMEGGTGPASTQFLNCLEIPAPWRPEIPFSPMSSSHSRGHFGAAAGQKGVEVVVRAEGKGKELMGLPITPCPPPVGKASSLSEAVPQGEPGCSCPPFYRTLALPTTPDWPGIPLALFWISSLNSGG